jgi:hypothetical protein
MKNWIFRVFGYAIFGLGTRLVRDWYAIKVLIISSVTRFRDFFYILRGSEEKTQKNIGVGVGKGRKWCNRVPVVFWLKFLEKFMQNLMEFLWGFWRLGVFVGFLAVGSFCGVFGNGGLPLVLYVYYIHNTYFYVIYTY